jgi:lipoprotein-anchoring transpeptidase ErfK/SrfK
VTVDTVAPSLQISTPAKGATITDTDAPLAYGRVPAEDPRGLTFAAVVNGKVVTTARGSDAASPDTGYSEASATETAGFQIDGHDFALPLGTLPQGRSVVTVSATDAAGNVAKVRRRVTVDSTDAFGSDDLRLGARGGDVKELQKRLREAGVFPKRARMNGRFDAVTQLAVFRYQGRFKLPRTKVVDQRTRRALVGRIVVNLGQRKLRLIRNGRVVVTYPIAIGQPAYPTPTGDYEINDKQVDPAWYPPDSPWAAELKTIPPGPGNPLGTRWIGTTAPAVGIHGTYAEYTVGTAASHGCMRMKIKDVEALYEQVALGMEVRILP